MRLSTSGRVPRVDHSLLVEVLVPLREEWAALRFDAAGDVVNPVTGASLDALRLVEGRHRAAGARYEVNVRTPVMGADPERAAALDAERLNRPDIDDDEYLRRRLELYGPTGEVHLSTNRFTLRGDDSRALSVTFTDPNGLWTVDIDVVHGRIPRVEVAGRADATSMMLAEDVPRWLARRVGGDAAGTATIDLATFEHRGTATFVDAKGRLRLVRASASATVTPEPAAWDVAATIDVMGRGLGRLALRMFRNRIQRSFDAAAATYWKQMPENAAGLQKFLAQLRVVVDGEGGVAPLLHTALWEPARLEGLEAKYDLG